MATLPEERSRRYDFSTPTKPRPVKTPPKPSLPHKVPFTKDIFTVDAIIKTIFRKKAEEVPLIDAKIESLEDIVKYSPDAHDRRKAKAMIESLKAEREFVTSGLGPTLYSLKTTPILSTYRKACPPRDLSGNFESASKRDGLVVAYLAAARQFVTLDIPKDILDVREACQECASYEVAIDDGHYVCQVCHSSTPVVDDTSGADSKAMGVRYSYTPRVHMNDAIEKFSCTSGSVSHEIIEGVRKAMSDHHLTPATVTKNFIYSHLTDSKKTEAYSQINFIYCEITGEPPPDIEKYKEELLEMSDQFEIAFKQVEPDRSNSMTVLWKLYMFLNLLDFSCSRDDFYCLKIPEKQEDREHDWNRTVDLLMELYPNAMTSNGKKRWRHISAPRRGVDFFA